MARVVLGAAAVAGAAIIVIASVVRIPDTERLPPLSPFPVDSMEPTVRRQMASALDRVQDSPTDAAANGHLGMLYHAYGFYTLAEPCYLRAARLASDDTRWPFYLGLVLAERGAWLDAVAALDEVLAVRGDDAVALLYRADANRRLNRLDEARAEYRTVLELAPTMPQAYCGAGQVAFEQGDLAGAVVLLEEALRLASRYGTARYVLGQALRKLGRLDDARRQLALAEGHLETEPPVDDARLRELAALRTGAIDALHRGIDLSQAGQYLSAIELLAEAVRIDPALAEAHAQLGAAHLAGGDVAEAQRHLRRALEIEPGLADAHYNLGLAAHRRGDFEQAIVDFEQAVDVRPDHFDAHLGLGTDLVRFNRDDEAIGHLKAALRLRPDDARPPKRLAAAFWSAGRYGQALEILRAAAGRLPEDAAVADRLAWVLATSPRAELRDPAEALRIADEVCARTGNSVPQALATRAAALAGLGRFPEAIETAGEALELARAEGRDDLAREVRAQIDGYQEGRPWYSPPRP